MARRQTAVPGHANLADQKGLRSRGWAGLAQTGERKAVRDSGSETPPARAREFDPRHPLRLRTGPRRPLEIAADGPEDKVHAAMAAQAIGAAGDRRGYFDPITGGDLDGLSRALKKPLFARVPAVGIGMRNPTDRDW